MFFKKFFSKEEDVKQEDSDKSLTDEDYIASLTYSVSKDGEVYMDVTMSDYEDKTLQNFAKVIAGVSSIKFQLQTIEMIQTSLCSIGEEEIFTKLVEYVLKETQRQADTLDKISNQALKQENNQEEQPWIKPSQLTN
tara:strand:+ start:238 stop:648 length:411 start_codon:yes stop_codon:yes gene_type:complete